MPPAFTLEPRRREQRRRRRRCRTPCRRDHLVRRGVRAHRHGDASRADRATRSSTTRRAASTRSSCSSSATATRSAGAATSRRRAPQAPIEQLSLPLGGASSLQAAHDTGQPYVGPPPSAARPIETAAVDRDRRDAGAGRRRRSCRSSSRSASSTSSTRTCSAARRPALIDELTDLAARAQQSYQRLIRQARGS